MAFKYLAHISDNKAMLLHKVTFSSEQGLVLVTTVVGFRSYTYFRRCPDCL